MSTHRPHTHPFVLTLLILALLTALGSSPAAAKAGLGEVPLSAKSQLYGPGLWHEAPEGRTWYGAYRTFPDTYAYCIDAGKQSPLPENFTDAKAQTVTAPQTAWALSRYSDSDSADVQAALSAIARADKRIDHDHTVPPQEPDELGKKFAGAAKKYAQITAEAKRFAGPYTLSVDLEPVLDMPKLEPYDAKPDAARPDDGKELSLPTTNTVTLTVSLTSASGTEVPDVPVSLTITGADGPTSVTSGEKPTTAKLTASQPGTVTVSAEASLAPTTVKLFAPTSGTRVQRVITPDEPTTVTDSAEVDLTSQPRVTTEISEQTPQPGDEVTDTFTVAGLIGDDTVTVVHELWATTTKPEIGKKNDDAESIGTVTSRDIGNGTHTSAGIRIPEDFRGWVYFTETVAGDETTKEWTGIHGQPKETGFVPWTPTASTQAEIAGTQVTDEITVSGLRPGAEAKLTVTAYRTDAQPKQSPEASGTEIDVQDFTVVADQEGTASVSTAPIETPVGWVTFVTSIAEDEVHRGWTSDWGIPSETVNRPPAEKPSPPPSTKPPAPSTAPPVEPVAEKPEATADELPRTGAEGNAMLIGIGIVLIGVGAATLIVTGRQKREQ